MEFQWTSPRAGQTTVLASGDSPHVALSPRRYCFRASAEEIVATFSATFDALVGEMRVDDLLDRNPSALQRMGYPTLRTAFGYPKALGEVIETFLGRDILARFVPFGDSSKFVINTIHTLSVTETAVVLEGACFAVPR